MEKIHGIHFVSIPKRVSEALKPNFFVFFPPNLEVSIPKRVSEALKLYAVTFITMMTVVSIPKRVSEALKLILLGNWL